jgi:hypothetical protein
MIADLMHAQIDRRKYAIPEKYGNRYQLENSSGVQTVGIRWKLLQKKRPGL